LPGVAWLGARVSLRSVPRCLRVVAARTPGLEPGTSSLSGLCIRSCFPRIAPATWVNDVPLETLRTARFLGCGPNVDQPGAEAGWPGPVRSWVPVALRFSATRDRSAGRARQGQCQARGLALCEGELVLAADLSAKDVLHGHCGCPGLRLGLQVGHHDQLAVGVSGAEGGRPIAFQRSGVPPQLRPASVPQHTSSPSP
jgi:hypothetical protein